MVNNRKSVSASAQNVSLLTIRSRVKDRQLLRKGFLNLLFPLIPNPFAGDVAEKDKPTQILNDIANSFSRYAGYQQTAYDNGASRSNSSTDSSTMARQVEQAFNKVLGRSYGNNPDGFVSALNSAFPVTTTADGPKVSSMPSRSMVWLYSPNGSGNVASSTNSFAGQLPARQATLYRQASIIAADALQVLAGLKPFLPEANLEQVEALRAQVHSEINALIDEFGRIDEPRSERVTTYLNTLTFHVAELGRRGFLDNPALVTTDEDEAQTAAFALLKNYTITIRDISTAFFKADRDPTSQFFSLSERVERATIILPIIAQANADFEAAMDSVDFPESDRRSVATKFTELTDFSASVLGVKIPLEQADITIYDLTDWLDRFANIESPSSLADSGQYGLDFVTDQADTLFWVIAPIIAHFKTTSPSSASSSGNTTLEQVLSNERVIWSLNSLLTQLNALANLGVPGEKRIPVELP